LIQRSSHEESSHEELLAYTPTAKDRVEDGGRWMNEKSIRAVDNVLKVLILFIGFFCMTQILAST